MGSGLVPAWAWLLVVGEFVAKNILTIAFVSVFFYSLWVYFTREEKSLRDNLLEKGSESPKLAMENLFVQRYQNGFLDARLQANKARFIEPNQIEISGTVRLDRMRGDKMERIAADHAIATFQSSDGKGVMSNGELISAVLRDNVRVDFTDYRLLTDFAEYFADQDAVISDHEVLVRGEKKWFRGKDGFRVGLTDETIELFGEVNGEAFVE